jgi:hypothetical protein
MSRRLPPRGGTGIGLSDQPIPHIPMPHPPAPQPPDGWEIGSEAPGPEFARAAAGTLNSLISVVPLHRGHRGTSLEERTRVSKA